MNKKIFSIFMILLLVGSLLPAALADNNQFYMLFAWDDFTGTHKVLEKGEQSYFTMYVAVSAPVEANLLMYREGQLFKTWLNYGDWYQTQAKNFLIDTNKAEYTPGNYELVATVTDNNENTESLTLTLEIKEEACEDADGDGICDEDEIYGCTDSEATNYNPLATEDDGSCEFACEDIDGDGVCDEDEVLGCTNVNALNYNPLATDDDGSCEYAPDNENPEFYNLGSIYTVDEMQTLNIPVLIVDGDSTTLSVSVCHSFLGFELCNFAVPEGMDIVETSKNHFYLSWTPDYSFVTHPSMSKNIKLRLTASDGELYAYHGALITVNGVNQIPEVDINSNAPIKENEVLSIIFTATDSDAEDGLSFGADNIPTWASYQNVGNQVFITGNPGCDGAGVYTVDFAVTDGYALVEVPHNFQVLEFCDLPCEDTDGDGVCDVDEVFGCTDTHAYNYNPLATEDDGSCDIMEVYSCTVDSLVGDVNGDGQVTVEDADLISKYLTNYPNLNLDNICCFDVNGDGEISIHDVMAIMNHIAGLPGGEFSNSCKEPNDEPVFVGDLEDFYEIYEMDTLLIDFGVVDQSDVELQVQGLPAGAELIDFGNDHFQFIWTPDYTEVVHPETLTETVVSFAATDGELTTYFDIIIMVKDINQLIEFEFSGNGPINEQEELLVTLTANDADLEDTIDVVSLDAPEWVEYLINDGIGFFGTPDCSQAGQYIITAVLTDGYDEVTTEYTFDVLESCDVPCEDLNDNDICDVDEVLGCMDPEALNFDHSANVDDGSCIAVVEGCTDADAFNYDPLANVDDGSCVAVVEGCTNADALNYNPLANVDDGSCIAVVEGCTDVDALNYNPLANVDDSSCEYACVDTDGDGVCDEDEIAGCTDESADNYDVLATDDDGSCEYLGCMDPEALNFDHSANVDDGGCEYACVDTDGDGVCDEDEIAGCTDESADNYDVLATDDDGSCEYAPDHQPPYLTINGPDIVYEGEELTITVDLDDEELLVEDVEVYMEKCILFYCYNTDLPDGAEFNIVGEDGALTWTPNYNFVTHPDVSEEITFVFVANDGEYMAEQEITVNVLDVNQLPELEIQTNEPFGENKEIQVVIIGTDADEEDELSYEVNNVPEWLSVNIDENLISISGVPPCNAAGVYELEISVTDGIDVVTVVVVLDIAETCEFACVDTDNDGVCDEDEVLGCTDATAGNYNPLATEDDGTCEFACVDLDNDSICDFEDPCVDQDNDGICDDQDACPLDAEDFDDYLDEDGCPESHDDANIASVHLNSETLVPGDYLSMYIRMSNSGDTYFSDMRAEAIVYEWGMKAATGEFNLQPGQEKGRNLVMQVPYDVQPGDYLIKVTLENDYYHESMYRLVTIY